MAGGDDDFLSFLKANCAVVTMLGGGGGGGRDEQREFEDCCKSFLSKIDLSILDSAPVGDEVSTFLWVPVRKTPARLWEQVVRSTGDFKGAWKLKSDDLWDRRIYETTIDRPHSGWLTVPALQSSTIDADDKPIRERKHPLDMYVAGGDSARMDQPENENFKGMYGPLMVHLYFQVETEKGGLLEVKVPIRFRDE